MTAMMMMMMMMMNFRLLRYSNPRQPWLSATEDGSVKSPVFRSATEPGHQLGNVTVIEPRVLLPTPNTALSVLKFLGRAMEEYLF
jgi:hypothetical protein